MTRSSQRARRTTGSAPKTRKGTGSGSACTTARNEPLQLLELPSPVWVVLISLLDERDRVALFRSSRALADVLVKHARGVTMQPSQHLVKDAARRSTALQLVSGCANLHLSVRWLAPPLPPNDALLLRGITRLTLQHVLLSSHVAGSLRLRQLHSLHSLSLVSSQAGGSQGRFRHGALDQAALSAVVSDGGFGALRQLRCEAADDADCRLTLSKLGAVLGHQITRLEVNHMACLHVLPEFKGLRELVVTRRAPSAAAALPPTGADEGDGAVALPKQHVQNLVGHPSLRQVVVPELELDETTDCSGQRVAWELLHISGMVSEAVLARLPLQGLQLLRVDGGLMALRLQQEERSAALQNLCRCGRVEWRPVTGHPHNVHTKGVPKHLPLFTLTMVELDAQLVTQCCSELQGGLELRCVRAKREAVAHALAAIPKSVTTLVLSAWAQPSDCGWEEVWELLPDQIEHLVLYGCAITQEQLAPLFLKLTWKELVQLTLTPVFEHLTWIHQHEHEVEPVAARAGVHLHVHRPRAPTTAAAAGPAV